MNAMTNLLVVRVKIDAQEGANCTILPANVIGENTLNVAGLVVTCAVSAGIVCAGNNVRKNRLAREISEDEKSYRHL
jgi:acetyltransferase-like isoleucine patch superfamily enzyme